MMEELSRKDAFVREARPLLLLSLAFWVVHALLRFLLLFRLDPYGIPFVNKPDWYIFHALTLDYVWILNLAFAWMLGAFALRPASRLRRALLPSYAGVHGLMLLLTLLDQEVQRFLGMHLTFGLADTYKDASSLRMFVDYVRMDQSVPYLQFVLVLGLLPLVYACFRFLARLFPERSSGRLGRLALGVVLFYGASWLFLHVIWTGAARLHKLAPVVALIGQELEKIGEGGASDTVGMASKIEAYQRQWQLVQGDSSWVFTDKAYPLLRASNPYYKDERALRQRAMRPNFLVVFLESQRGLNVGFLNRFAHAPSPTPCLDSLARSGIAWSRLHASGVPTIGGLLSTHLGIPPHTRLNQVMDLVQIRSPSFVSVLRDSGYAAHYYSAADPAWDNLGNWMRKWYDGVHYDRGYEDDSSFWEWAGAQIRDSLGTGTRPFVATLMTRSNHYPFDFAPGMPEPEKAKPVQERIRYTMAFADRQMRAFLNKAAHDPWFANTYLVILADHGFPMGENGVATMSGGAHSSVTWVPLVIVGPGLAPGQLYTQEASQIDIGATVLGLAGVRASTPSMGHDLLRGHGQGLGLGSHYGFGTLSYQGYRLIASLREGQPQHLYADADTWQNEDVIALHKDRAAALLALQDTLLDVADFSLERDKLVPMLPSKP